MKKQSPGKKRPATKNMCGIGRTLAYVKNDVFFADKNIKMHLKGNSCKKTSCKSFSPPDTYDNGVLCTDDGSISISPDDICDRPLAR